MPIAIPPEQLVNYTDDFVTIAQKIQNIVTYGGTKESYDILLAIANDADSYSEPAKSALISILSNYGITANTTEKMTDIVNKVSSIKQGQGNAVEANVLAPKTFTNSDGVLRTGTMVNQGAETKVTSVKSLTNIVTNGGFEYDLSSWTINNGGGLYALDASVVKYDTKSLKIFGAGGSVWFDNPINQINGHKYYFGRWMNVTSWTSGNAIFEIYNNSTTIMTSATLGATTSGWQYNSGTYTSIGGNSFVRCGQWSPSTYNLTAYFDGITIIDLTATFGAGSEPTQAQMDTIITTMGGWFNGTCLLASMPNGAYLTNGITGKPEILTASDDLQPYHLLIGRNVFGVAGTLTPGGVGNTFIVASSHPTTNAPIDLASIRLEFYNRIFPNNLSSIQVLKNGSANVYGSSVINTTGNDQDQESIYITLNENFYPGTTYNVVVANDSLKDKFNNLLKGVNYQFVTNSTPSAWSTNTNGLITARGVLAGCGTQDAGLAFGGQTTVTVPNTEKFNGNTWNSTGNLITAREHLAGCGTQDAGLSISGYGGGSWSTATEKFNGSTWSSTGGTVARSDLAGCGTQNAALNFGGNNGSGYYSNAYKFDGTSWSATGNMPSARDNIDGLGTQNAAIGFGGGSTSTSSSVGTYSFNGSTWSTANNMNVKRRDSAGSGTQDAGLAFGGYDVSFLASTEKFNGSIWSTTGNLNVARSDLAGCGTQSLALSFGSYSPNSSTTEKFFG